MHLDYIRRWRANPMACSSIILALSVCAFGADTKPAVDTIKTATPIKHVIIIVGESQLRSPFRHLCATKQERESIEPLV